MALLRGRELQVAPQVQLLGGDGLSNVAANDIDLARLRIDGRDHVAMGAPDRARRGAAAELRANTLAHHLFTGVGERGLALLANQIARARLRGGERTGPIEPVAGLVGRLSSARRK